METIKFFIFSFPSFVFFPLHEVSLHHIEVRLIPARDTEAVPGHKELFQELELGHCPNNSPDSSTNPTAPHTFGFFFPF